MNKSPSKMGRHPLPPHLVKSCRSFSFNKSQHKFIADNGGNKFLRKLVVKEMLLKGVDVDV